MYQTKQTIIKYDTFFEFGVTFDILDLGILGHTICFSAGLKKGFFESCFQQDANSKMTARTSRKHHVFSKNSTL